MTINENELILDKIKAGEPVEKVSIEYGVSLQEVRQIIKAYIGNIGIIPKPERKPVSICFDPKTKELYTLYDDHTVWLTYMQRNLASVTSKTILISDHTESKDWIE